MRRGDVAVGDGVVDGAVMRMVVVDVREGVMLAEAVDGGGEIDDETYDVVRRRGVIERQHFYVVY